MTLDHTVMMHGADGVDRVLRELGFGMVMATAFLMLITQMGAKPGRAAILFIMLGGTVLCMCFAAWAQSIHFVVTGEAAKVAAIVAACAIAGAVALIIVQRAPPAALLACFAILLVCGLLGALAIWAPTHNLFLLVVALFIVAMLAAFGLIVWAQIRMDERRPIVIEQAPHHAQIQPREIDRGPLLAATQGTRALQPHKRNLPCQKS
jgi:hypothetical protein